MANGNIVLDFVTKLKDNMTPALKGVIGNAQSMAKSTLGSLKAAASTFSQSLGDIGGQIGKIAGMGGQLLKGLANPWTAIATAATIAITKIYSHYKKQIDDLKDYTKKVAEDLGDMFVRSGEKALNSYKNITAELDKQSKYKDMGNALGVATDKANASEAAFNISKSYIPRINAASTNEERAVLEAERDLAIATNARAQGEKSRDRQRSEAARKVEEAEYKLANAQATEASLHDKWVLAAQQKDINGTQLASLRKQYEQAQKATAEAQMKLAEATNDQAILQQNFRTEQLKQQQDINAANDKLNHAKKQEAEAAQKKAEADKKEAEKKEKEEKQKEIDRKLKEIDDEIERQEKAEIIKNNEDTIDQLEADKKQRIQQGVQMVNQQQRLVQVLNEGRATAGQMLRGMQRDYAMNEWGDAYDYGPIDENGVPIGQVARDRATRYGTTDDRYKANAINSARKSAAAIKAARENAHVEQQLAKKGIDLKDKEGNDIPITEAEVDKMLKGKKPHGVSDKEWEDFWKRRRQKAGSAGGQRELENSIDALQQKIKDNTDQIKINTDKIADAMENIDKAMSPN